MSAVCRSLVFILMLFNYSNCFSMQQEEESKKNNVEITHKIIVKDKPKLSKVKMIIWFKKNNLEKDLKKTNGQWEFDMPKSMLKKVKSLAFYIDKKSSKGPQPKTFFPSGEQLRYSIRQNGSYIIELKLKTKNKNKKFYQLFPINIKNFNYDDYEE